MQGALSAREVDDARTEREQHSAGDMKEITTYIKAPRLAPVIQALYRNESVNGVSLCDIRGFGRNRSPNGEVAALQDLVNAVPYVKVEIVCPDDSLSEILGTIELIAHTGNPGDGKIFVVDVCHATRISTSEHGNAAVSGPIRTMPLLEDAPTDSTTSEEPRRTRHRETICGRPDAPQDEQINQQ